MTCWARGWNKGQGKKGVVLLSNEGIDADPEGGGGGEGVKVMSFVIILVVVVVIVTVLVVVVVVVEGEEGRDDFVRPLHGTHRSVCCCRPCGSEERLQQKRSLGGKLTMLHVTFRQSLLSGEPSTISRA